ncbi:DUF732 domain-containing protein [Rhodococcus xishaensis]|uniref:DUF732 domain-containing protein n=1 Tax=Rhodococcus xishaensis TaxID=2487364 RepID=UPI0013E3F5BE|nr:DUF732 domain-containing protein [Rhodococcus xishaensis]
MIRTTRLGLLAALCTALLVMTGCSSTPDATPDDADAVVLAQTSPNPTTTDQVEEAPHPDPSAPPAPEADTNVVPVAEPPLPQEPTGSQNDRDAASNPVLGGEDLLFLSYITDFNLIQRPEADQIRLGRSICDGLNRGQSKPDLTAELVTDGGYSGGEVANVLMAATVAYCPQFA